MKVVKVKSDIYKIWGEYKVNRKRKQIILRIVIFWPGEIT